MLGLNLKLVTQRQPAAPLTKGLVPLLVSGGEDFGRGLLVQVTSRGTDGVVRGGSSGGGDIVIGEGVGH